MINDDHLIYNTKGKSFKYLVWQINILLTGRQWTVKIVSHWTLQRNLETHFNCVPFHFNIDPSKYSMVEAGFDAETPQSIKWVHLSGCCQNQYHETFDSVSPTHPRDQQTSQLWLDITDSGFYELIKLGQEVSSTGESRDKCLHNQHPIW